MSSHRVFFGRLPFGLRTQEFADVITVDYERIVLKHGYGFVDFYTKEDGQKCIDALHDKELFGDGRRTVVEFAKGKERKASDFRHSRYDDDYRSRRKRSIDYDDRSPRRRRSDDRRKRSYDADDRRRERRSAPYNTEWRLRVKNISSRVGWQVFILDVSVGAIALIRDFSGHFWFILGSRCLITNSVFLPYQTQLLDGKQGCIPNCHLVPKEPFRVVKGASSLTLNVLSASLRQTGY